MLMLLGNEVICRIYGYKLWNNELFLFKLIIFIKVDRKCWLIIFFFM